MQGTWIQNKGGSRGLDNVLLGIVSVDLRSSAFIVAHILLWLYMERREKTLANAQASAVQG